MNLRVPRAARLAAWSLGGLLLDYLLFAWLAFEPLVLQSAFDRGLVGCGIDTRASPTGGGDHERIVSTWPGSGEFDLHRQVKVPGMR